MEMTNQDLRFLHFGNSFGSCKATSVPRHILKPSRHERRPRRKPLLHPALPKKQNQPKPQLLLWFIVF
eukprot:327250-Amphidinium_carterae.1